MTNKYRLGILATHPIQYFSPWYRALAAHPEIELQVYFAHRQTPEGQAAAGFGVPFEWDQALLDGYSNQFLVNKSRKPSTDSFLGCDTPEISEIIAQKHFDAFLVSGWHAKSYWQAIRACWKTGTPVLVRGDSQLATNRSVIKQALKAPLYRWFIPRLDGYLIVGKRAKDYLIHYGAAEKKMFSVPHAVDNQFFKASAVEYRRDKSAWRRQWGLPAEGIVFLFVGKLLARKRPMDFLRALCQSAAGSPGIYGLVVGDGPLRSEMESYAKSYHVPVQFTGFLNQSAIPKAYAAADALVLPSDGSETWGLVVNEAMASGLPAFVSDEVGCGPDLILPGRTGEIFRCGNVEHLSTILSYARDNPESLRTKGEVARHHVESYSVEKGVQGMIEALKFVWRQGK